MRIKSADLKNEFLVPEFFGFPRGSDAMLSSLSRPRRCSRNRSPSRLPVSPMCNFLQRVQVMQQMTLADRGRGEMSTGTLRSFAPTPTCVRFSTS